MSRLRDANYDRPAASLEDGVRQYVGDYLTAEGLCLTWPC